MGAARINRKHRWFSFSLRSLLIVVTILCVGLGWKMHQVRNLRRAVAEVHRLGGDVNFRYELDRAPPVEPPGPKWLRRILGDDFFVEVNQIQIYTDQANDESLAIIASLPHIDSLIVRSNGITDKGLASFSQASGLEALELRSTKITGAGYLQLKELLTLKSLILRDDSTVTDAWLSDIAELKQVRYLFLQNTQITDRGLAALRPATWLRQIDLTGTKVTKDGVDQLKKALPKCRITWP
jgi:Leucine Rich repeat